MSLTEVSSQWSVSAERAPSLTNIYTRLSEARHLHTRSNLPAFISTYHLVYSDKKSAVGTLHLGRGLCLSALPKHYVVTSSKLKRRAYYFCKHIHNTAEDQPVGGLSPNKVFDKSVFVSLVSLELKKIIKLT